MFESLRKRRNHTEETAEEVVALKAQLETLQEKQLETKRGVLEWQEKVSAQIDNLVISFHERLKARAAQSAVDNPRAQLKAMKQETQKVLSSLKPL